LQVKAGLEHPPQRFPSCAPKNRPLSPAQAMLCNAVLRNSHAPDFKKTTRYDISPPPLPVPESRGKRQPSTQTNWTSPKRTPARQFSHATHPPRQCLNLVVKDEQEAYLNNSPLYPRAIPFPAFSLADILTPPLLQSSCTRAAGHLGTCSQI